MEQQASGLVHAIVFDGQGGGRNLGWKEVEAWRPDQGFLWIHLDYSKEDSRRWLSEFSGIEPLIQDCLSAEETRPRSLLSQDGLLVILRAVNMNPGAEPEDMVALRVWIDATKVVTLRQRRVFAVEDLRTALRAGNGPHDAGEFLVEMCDLLALRIGEVLSDLDDSVDALEDEVLTAGSYELRTRIGGLRRQSIALRRFLAPQRETMARLQSERVSWLEDLHRQHLREVADRVTRFVEDLDSARDRAAVIQEELNTRISDQMNRTMYMLSIVAAIFLPLGLLTGLLGINVGGIPGTENPWAFTVVCVLLVLLAVVLGILFRVKRVL